MGAPMCGRCICSLDALTSALTFLAKTKDLSLCQLKTEQDVTGQ